MSNLESLRTILRSKFTKVKGKPILEDSKRQKMRNIRWSQNMKLLDTQQELRCTQNKVKK
jgi:hypothetical protein